MATYTGNTTAIAISGCGVIGQLQSVNGFSWTRPALNSSVLSTRYFEAYVPGDLWDAGEMSCDFLTDPDSWLALNDDDTPWESPIVSDLDDSGTITVTFPTPEGGLTGAQLIGTGMVSGVSMGELVNNELLTGTMTIQWDNKYGNQGPFFFAST